MPTKSKSVMIDQDIRDKAYKEARDKYKGRWSAYAAGYMAKRYKAMGGRYKGVRADASLRRWYREKWIDVCHLPQVVPCGRSDIGKDRYGPDFPYCRPSVRVNKSTPRTAYELSRAEIRKRCARKKRNPKKTVR